MYLELVSIIHNQRSIYMCNSLQALAEHNLELTAGFHCCLFKLPVSNYK
jgi:hypothetical protein